MIRQTRLVEGVEVAGLDERVVHVLLSGGPSVHGAAHEPVPAGELTHVALGAHAARQAAEASCVSSSRCR
ncbi:hypothetical protein AB0L71_16090 [Streptomyces sp. NPDC052052]|uniref:hypothetical protein n=1 Tax=Streptomyces sp. NPDC052052 TaxID=3154756 RepID=UPI00343E3EE5